MQVSKQSSLPLLAMLATAAVTSGCDQTPGAVSASTPEAIVDLGLSDPAYYITLGNEFRANQRPEQAIAAYRRATQVDFDNLEAYIHLAHVLTEQRRLDEAIAAYRRAIQVNGRDARAYVGLGKALAELKRTEEAIAAYRRAIQVSPEQPDAYTGLAELLSGENRLAEALNHYQKALNLSEKPSANTHTLALVGLGRALQAQNKLEDAIAMFRRAIQVSPSNTWAYIYLGRALTEKKQFNDANALYKHVLKLPNVKKTKLGTSHAMALNGLGMILQRQGKLSPAIAVYEQAVELDLSYETAHKNLKGAKRLLARQSKIS